MKHLLLFDIDGTLISGGPAKEAFHEGLMAAYGTVGDIEGVPFSGKTDRQIARELLRGGGLTDGEIDAGMDTLISTYLAGLEARLPSSPVTVLPGVFELMDRLAALEDVALGLVTGNVEGGARLKLSGDGLDRHFRIGAYGSDSEHRDDLPGIALERARAAWDVDFAADRVVVIGDTPADVQCGKAHGLRTMAVATGNFALEDLYQTGADTVVPDFSKVDDIVEQLTAAFA